MSGQEDSTLGSRTRVHQPGPCPSAPAAAGPRGRDHDLPHGQTNGDEDLPATVKQQDAPWISLIEDGESRR
jgi:hypothetical protein